MFTAGFRYTIAGILFFGVAAFSGIPLPTRRQFLASAWVGFLLAGLGNCAIAFALKTMPSGLVSVLCALVPLLMALIDWFFFSGTKPNKLSAMGLILGLFGILYLVNPFSASTQTPILPTLLVFGGCFAWAWGTVQAPHLSQTHPLQATGIQLFTGGIFSLLVSAATEHHQIEQLMQGDTRFWVAMSYLIFIGSGIGYTAYVWLMQHAPPRLTATYAYVNPVVAMFLGWFVLHEQLTSQSILSSGIVLVGVALMVAAKK